MSKHSHLYLGSNGEGPAPVFRDLSPEGVRLPGGPLVSWPDDAVFAVYFSEDAFPSLPRGLRTELPRTEFFEADGWPLGLPASHRSLAPEVKREFQVYPGDWRSFDRGAWRQARRYPETLRLGRVQAAVVRSFLASVPPPPAQSE